MSNDHVERINQEIVEKRRKTMPHDHTERINQEIVEKEEENNVKRLCGKN